MTKPTIVVVGATGQQGGAVVNALLADGTFSVRGITRNVESPSAKTLQQKGVEVVQADADNVPSLVKAFEGAHGAYVVTAFWEHHDYKKEIQQVKNYAEAAKAANLKHVVASTLDDTRPVLAGKFKPIVDDLIVPHFDGKAIADQEFVKLGVPTTFLLTSAFYENWLSLMAPTKNQDGTYSLSLPFPSNVPYVVISVEDIGNAAAAILRKGSEYIGKKVPIAGDIKTLPEFAQIFSRVLGVPVSPVSIPRETYLSFGFPGVDDLANMFAFYETEAFLKSRSVEETQKVCEPVKVKSVEQWLQENKHKIKL